MARRCSTRCGSSHGPDAAVRPDPVLIGLHLIHEVTTPQAFQMLKELKLKVRMPERTFGTLDHIIPTADQTVPTPTLRRRRCPAHVPEHEGVRPAAFDMASGKQGIVHVIGPELGLSQPGMTIACGDSTRPLTAPSAPSPSASGPLRSATCWPRSASPWPSRSSARWSGGRARQGRLRQGRDPGDHQPAGREGRRRLRYEYAGPVIERMTMEERLTVCNMSIEGGARCGYVSPDATTIEYLRGRPYAPKDGAFDRAATCGSRSRPSPAPSSTTSRVSTARPSSPS